MPLGKLSKGQIAKGFDVLEKLENELKAKKNSKLADLSSEFYTVIPHDFGRQRPPSISSAEQLQQRTDMLMVRKNIHFLTLKFHCVLFYFYLLLTGTRGYRIGSIYAER